MEEQDISKEAKKILEYYFAQLKSKLKNLPRSERQEIVSEIRSDILAELHQDKLMGSGKQTELLLSILSKLGKPNEVADEIMSKKILSFRGNFLKRFFIFTFRSLMRALAGVLISFVFLNLYFIGFLNIAMAALKSFIPDRIGLFISEKGFSGYGFKMDTYDIALWSTKAIKGEEILGYWIIPLGIIFGLLLITTTNYLNIKTKKYFQ